ncbi:MAG: nucleotidyltransferase domain-containing protein [Patescibacteria group bacterium]
MTPQEIEAKLTTYILEKYNPLAIILHGSRANGNAREHADWDIAIITSEKKRPHREIVFGANVEYKEIVVPIPERTLISFALRTGNTKILHDTDSLAEKLIEQDDSVIEKGIEFTESERRARHAYLLSAIDGMRDYTDNSYILFDKKTDFFTRMTGAWFTFIAREYQPSPYTALPKIQKEDPEFYELIYAFADANSSEELVKIGNKIVLHLFPNLL